MTELFSIFIISMAVLYLLQATGRVNLGLNLPGLAPPLRKEYKSILIKYCKYYGYLSTTDRRKFDKRVAIFIKTKRFVPRQGLLITPVIKTLIAASAVQLTFGLPKHALYYFSTILVYPDDYYSTINKQYHKGEVNPKLKAIVISWQSFLDGYVNPHDGRNLGLHEMAHALHLEHMITRRDYQYLDHGLWADWNDLAKKEMQKIKSGDNNWLRAYAGENLHEFFAVSVEYFFERAKEVQEKAPDIYKLLSKLLKQDPLSLQQNSQNG